MGYDLRITREDQPNAEEAPTITAEEWLAFVEEDGELSLAGYNGEYFALWNGPSSHIDAWFDWWDGTIKTKNPDPSMVAKMVEMAERLGASVKGDDGETYLPDGRLLNYKGQFEGQNWKTE